MSARENDSLSVLTCGNAESLQYIARIETASDSIRLRGFSAHEFENIVDAVEYIDTKFRNQTSIEEQILFPLLEHSVPEQLGKLREEHKQLWTTFKKLQRSVRDIQEGHVYGTSIVELTTIARIMAKLLYTHINDEENLLLPLVKRLLSLPMNMRE